MENKKTWSTVLDIFVIVSTILSGVWGFMNEGFQSSAVMWAVIILVLWIVRIYLYKFDS